jgi:hypothetical protein
LKSFLYGGNNPYIEKKVKQRHWGAKASKGIYDYGGRSEKKIIKKNIDEVEK